MGQVGCAFDTVRLRRLGILKPRKNAQDEHEVKGHDFSRAVNCTKQIDALALE
jgi:hypothetical protein